MVGESGYQLVSDSGAERTAVSDVAVRFGELLQAAHLCLHNRLPGPALCLTYVAMDVAASVDYRVRKEHSKDRFVRWVERYVQPDTVLRCTALDLYGARCGLLHDYSPASGLSSRGHAAEIWYAYHEHEADKLRTAARSAGHKSKIILSLEQLLPAVTEGVMAFISDLQKDDRLVHWATDAIARTFQFHMRVGDEFRPFPSLEELGDLGERIRKVCGETPRADAQP